MPFFGLPQKNIENGSLGNVEKVSCCVSFRGWRYTESPGTDCDNGIRCKIKCGLQGKLPSDTTVDIACFVSA
jgi:hypothetical protein